VTVGSLAGDLTSSNGRLNAGYGSDSDQQGDCPRPSHRSQNGIGSIDCGHYKNRHRDTTIISQQTPARDSCRIALFGVRSLLALKRILEGLISLQKNLHMDGENGIFNSTVP